MIAHLNGRMIEKSPTHVIIECGGVGYFVKISLNTYSQLGDKENLKIFTQLQVREDSHTLYGFSHLSEREMFNHLISVSGIGANTAIVMLSSLTPNEIGNAIVNEKVDVIQNIKGIGAKTAQRVILDLKDKVIKSEFTSENIFTQDNTNQNDALNALLALGFDKKKAQNAVSKVAIDGTVVEDIIKEALKIL